MVATAHDADTTQDWNKKSLGDSNKGDFQLIKYSLDGICTISLLVLTQLMYKQINLNQV